jgi:hypothetical protein
VTVARIEVKAGDTVTVKVSGPAVVRIGPPGGTPKPLGATMAGLAEAIALVTARRHGIGADLSGDVPASAVAAALTILAAAFLGAIDLQDQGAGLLPDLGLAAAREDSGPTGRTTAP